MEKEKNIFLMKIKYNLKGNIYMEKEMVKEKNTLIMMTQNLKENTQMEKEMEKEKNIGLIVVK